MKMQSLVLAILAVVILVSFFLPWVHVESQMIGTVTKILTGARETDLTSISGFAVPGLANGPDARLMISIIKIFHPGVTDADKKSWLIWGVPLLAIAIFLLSLGLGENRWFNLCIAALGIFVFVAGVYKIKTTDLDKLVLNAKIGIGMWLTLFGYLGIGVVGAMNFLRAQANKK